MYSHYMLVFLMLFIIYTLCAFYIYIMSIYSVYVGVYGIGRIRGQGELP